MLQMMVSILLTILTVGCGGQRYVDYFPYHDDGTMKPKIALMPIIDSSRNDLSWDFSEEIADGLYYELMNCGEFYLASPKEMGKGWLKRNEINFFSNEASYEDFQNTDFVVAMEIIEHSLAFCDPCTHTIKQYPDGHPSNLLMTVRIRIKITDIRYCEPRTILYEVFKSTFASTGENCDFEEDACWKTPAYSKSYCGRAHQRVIRNLTKRLEEVIWSSK